MTFLLGIDIGTSSVKSTLIEAETARVLASAAREYPINKPRPGYAEQNPDDWWQGTVDTVQRAAREADVDRAEIGGIGLCGQMHGGVCLDRAGRPLRPAIIWADSRSSAQQRDLLARTTARELTRHAPGPPAAGFMAPTLMWLKQYEPETMANTATILLPKDYVRLQMTGECATDISDAAATWLFDIVNGEWSRWLLDLCGLEDAILPPVLASGDIAGTLRGAAANELGLLPGIPVIAGCADQPAQMLGHGIYNPGSALAIIGTGGQVIHPLETVQIDPHLRFHVFNHAVPQRWYALAAILSAGLSLRWLRDVLGYTAHPDAYTQLSALASEAPPGAEGLVFLPYLAGERTPLMDPDASGAFVGLRLHHTSAHLARAVMEGVALAMGECLALVTNAGKIGGKPRVIVSGGAAASPVWLQIQAAVYNTPLAVSTDADHATVGAALLAGVGCGVYDSFADACARLRAPAAHVQPDAAAAAFYQERRALFHELYDHLKDDMHRLSRG